MSKYISRHVVNSNDEDYDNKSVPNDSSIAYKKIDEHEDVTAIPSHEPEPRTESHYEIKTSQAETVESKQYDVPAETTVTQKPVEIQVTRPEQKNKAEAPQEPENEPLVEEQAIEPENKAEAPQEPENEPLVEEQAIEPEHKAEAPQEPENEPLVEEQAIEPEHKAEAPQEPENEPLVEEQAIEPEHKAEAPQEPKNEPLVEAQAVEPEHKVEAPQEPESEPLVEAQAIEPEHKAEAPQEPENEPLVESQVIESEHKAESTREIEPVNEVAVQEVVEGDVLGGEVQAKQNEIEESDVIEGEFTEINQASEFIASQTRLTEYERTEDGVNVLTNDSGEVLELTDQQVFELAEYIHNQNLREYEPPLEGEWIEAEEQQLNEFDHVIDMEEEKDAAEHDLVRREGNGVLGSILCEDSVNFLSEMTSTRRW